jgi:hypothetical protein
VRAVTACRAPIGHERLVAYWVGDLDAAEVAAIDDHLFGCDACTEESGRLAGLVQAFRTQIPPVITRDELERLRAKGAVLVETAFLPGRTQVVFDPRADLMIHRLGGLDLAHAERVEVTVRFESGGTAFEEPFAPFDRERGEVLIACQRHFAMFPPDVVFDVRVHTPAAMTETTYVVPHVYEP